MNKNNENEIKIYEGTIIEVPFVNKAGRTIPGASSLFFKTTEDRYFIKFRAGKVLREEVEKFINQPLKVKGYITFGLWDADSNNVQSRVGDYMAVMEILVI